MLGKVWINKSLDRFQSQTCSVFTTPGATLRSKMADTLWMRRRKNLKVPSCTSIKSQLILTGAPGLSFRTTMVMYQLQSNQMSILKSLSIRLGLWTKGSKMSSWTDRSQRRLSTLGLGIMALFTSQGRKTTKTLFFLPLGTTKTAHLLSASPSHTLLPEGMASHSKRLPTRTQPISRSTTTTKCSSNTFARLRRNSPSLVKALSGRVCTPRRNSCLRKYAPA